MGFDKRTRPDSTLKVMKKDIKGADGHQLADISPQWMNCGSHCRSTLQITVVHKTVQKGVKYESLANA